MPPPDVSILTYVFWTFSASRDEAPSGSIFAKTSTCGLSQAVITRVPLKVSIETTPSADSGSVFLTSLTVCPKLADAAPRLKTSMQMILAEFRMVIFPPIRQLFQLSQRVSDGRKPKVSLFSALNPFSLLAWTWIQVL